MNIRCARTEDLMNMQHCNLLCLPENYQMKSMKQSQLTSSLADHGFAPKVKSQYNMDNYDLDPNFKNQYNHI